MENEISIESISKIYNENDSAFWGLDLRTGDVYYSPQYYRMIGYEPQEETKDINFWFELMHPDDRKKIKAYLERDIEKNLPYSMEFRLKCKEGKWKWISGFAKVYKYDEKGNPTIIVGTHTDISKLKEKENTVKRKLEFERVISSISSRLLGEIRTDEAILESLNEIGHLLKADRVYVFLDCEKISMLKNVYEWSSDNLNNTDKLLSIPPQLLSFVKKILKKDQVIDINNLSNYPEEKKMAFELLKKYENKSFFIAPIHIKKEISGFIGLNFSDEAHASLNEMEYLLKITSKIVGNFLERKDQIKKTNQLNRILKSIRSVNHIITKEKDRDKLIKRSCETLVETKAFDKAWIVLLNENKELISSEKSGFDREVIPLENMMKKGMFTKCFKNVLEHSKTVVIENPKTSCSDCPISVFCENTSTFSKRLCYDNNIYGVLSVALPRIYLNDPEEKQLFEDISEDISFALHNLMMEKAKKDVDFALVSSEKRFMNKIKELLSHEEEIDNIELADIIDSESIQALMDSLYETTGIPMSILDLSGKILVHTGWQDICTKFHRKNHETSKNCLESDKYLTKGVKKGEFKGYKCKNNLVDFVTPIFIGNRLLGNFFYGQVLYKEDEVDNETFRRQARKYGFDEEKYLSALEKVPRINKGDSIIIMDFFAKFADMIANLGYTNLKLSKSLFKNNIIQNKLKKSRFSLIKTISNLTSVRDPYIGQHHERVCELSVEIAKKLKLNKETIEGIRAAALVHDIGKIDVPSDILNKPSKLSEIEYELVKKHANVGSDILRKASFEYPIADIILQHHERIDGSGYPNNLKGEEIKIEAKIIAVADVVDAMTSHRPYRPALSLETALEEIQRDAGKLYDSRIVLACLELFFNGYNIKTMKYKS